MLRLIAKRITRSNSMWRKRTTASVEASDEMTVVDLCLMHNDASTRQMHISPYFNHDSISLSPKEENIQLDLTRAAISP